MLRSVGREFLFPQELLNDELSFLLSPILLKGKITTLFSPGGVGKSTFVYRIIKYLLDGGRVGKVLCVFADADTTNDEFRALVEEYYNPDSPEESRFIPVFPSPSWWRAFKKDISERCLREAGIDLLVIDSLESFFELVGLDFFRSIGAFFSVLRRVAIQGISVLLLHHTNKGGELAGRSTIVNQSDVVYRLRKAGRYKWFGDALKHRGAKLLNGKLDFYAELTSEGVDISSDVLDDRYGYIVHLVRKVLSSKDKPLTQYELVNEVKKLAQQEGNEVGVNKVRQALAKFEGIYWKSERGGRNALEYTLIPPEVRVRNGEISFGSPRAELVGYLGELSKSITVFYEPIKVNSFSFSDVHSLLSYVEKNQLSEKEVLWLLERLKKDYPLDAFNLDF